jgi:hypothetical protein
MRYADGSKIIRIDEEEKRTQVMRMQTGMKEAGHRRGSGHEPQRGCITRACRKRLEEVLFYRIAGGRTAGIDP